MVCVYLIEKKEEADGEWQLNVLRPTMPLKTPWGCILFEKVLTDEIPFTKESFSEEYVSLLDLAENMGLSFALHKGILHMHQEETVETHEVPLETIPQDFMEKRLISGYVLTGESMRIACVYDGKKLYANLDPLHKDPLPKDPLWKDPYIGWPQRDIFMKEKRELSHRMLNNFW